MITNSNDDMKKSYGTLVFMSISLLVLSLGFSEAAWGQDSTHVMVFRVKNEATGKGLANATLKVKVPISSTEFKQNPYPTKEGGYCFIKIDKVLPLSKIKVLSIDGYNIVRRTNRGKNIWVKKTVATATKYQLILKGLNKQPITNAHFKFGTENFSFDEEGKLPFNIQYHFLDQVPVKIDVGGIGYASGVFTVYKEGSGKEGKYMYWTKENGGKTIKITLPILEKPWQYIVQNSRGERAVNYPIILSHNDTTIKTSQDGSILLRMKLEQPSIKDVLENISRVDGNTIDIKKIVKLGSLDVTNRVDTIKLQQKLKELEAENKRLVKEKESLIAEIKSYEKKDVISKSEIQRLKTKVEKLQLDYLQFINKFKKEILMDLASGDRKLQEQLSVSDTIVNQATFMGYLDAIVKAQAKQKSLQQRNFYLALSTIIFLLTIVGLLFWFRRRDKKNNQKLAEQLSQLNSQENLIKLLLREMKHRIGNDLITIQSKVSSINKKVKDKEAKKYLQETQKHIGKLLDIQESLSYSFSHEDQTSELSKQEMDSRLSNIVSTLFNFHFEKQNCPEFDLRVGIDNLIKSRFTLIGFCIFELVNNACKYALKNCESTSPQKVTIDLMQSTSHIMLVMENTGHGIESELFKNGEFLYDNVSSKQGMKIIRKITEVESGWFKIYTAGVHAEITEGSRFECTYKYPIKL